MTWTVFASQTTQFQATALDANLLSLRDGTLNVGVVGGTANAITLTMTPTVTAYVVGQVFRFIPTRTNTGATTIQVDSQTAVPVYLSAVPLSGGEIVAGRVLEVFYQGGSFQIANFGAVPVISGTLNLSAALNTTQAADVPSATTVNLDAAAGNVVQITGTTSISEVTLGAGRQRLVRFTGALTLTNGANLILPGNASVLTQAGDFAVFTGLASGVVYVSDYTRAGSVPAAFYESPERTIAFATVTNLTHGLVGTPKLTTLILRNKIAELNYSVGDEVSVGMAIADNDSGNAGRSRMPSIVANGTTLSILTPDLAGGIWVLNKTTAAISSITIANWKLVARAWG